MVEKDPQWLPPVGLPLAVANPGQDVKLDTGEAAPTDERLEHLPDFENNSLRGAGQTDGTEDTTGADPG